MLLQSEIIHFFDFLVYLTPNKKKHIAKPLWSERITSAHLCHSSANAVILKIIEYCIDNMFLVVYLVKVFIFWDAVMFGLGLEG